MLVLQAKCLKSRLRTYRSSNFAPSGHHEAPLSGSKEMGSRSAWKGEHEHDQKADGGQMHYSHSCDCPCLLLILCDDRHCKVALYKL
jgi:hypothetical protein